MSETTNTTATPEQAAPESAILTAVKAALNIGGTYQDAALEVYIAEVKVFLTNAGVSEANQTAGLVARGVADLWAYGSGEGKLSPYFLERAIQAAMHS